ncbi:MAG: amino acid permease [Candidatus Bathyarchaeota archaeon]|nr:MAG: amino acid permease [Candidatus Bathyarchaeota archaeon]
MSKTKTPRELGLFQAVIIGLGGAIGIEIFVLLNYATSLAESRIVLALFVCGIINLLTMLSFCELGAAIPRVGGEYSYAKAALGGFLAFLTGWLRWIGNVFGAALAAIGFAYHILYFMPLDIISLDKSLLTTLLAAAVIVVLTVLSIRGVRQMGTIIVIAFIAVFIIFIAVGVSRTRGLELQLYYPTTFEESSGFVAAITYTLLMFLGMRAIAAGGAVMKKPGKNIPRAIILSAVTLIVLYCGIAYVTISVVNFDTDVTRPTDLPLSIAAGKILGDAGALVLTIAGIIAALSSLSTAIMVQSSITRGLSRDGYLPRSLLSSHRRFKTPYVALIFGSVFYILFAATGVLEFIGSVAAFASLLGFALVNFSLMKLRVKKPYLQRPFKVPLYPYTPIAGIALSIILLVFIEPRALASSIGFIALGLLAYYLKMVGYHRIRIAFGGMSIGLGGFTTLAAHLVNMNYPLPFALSPQFARILFPILVVISVISILAGVFNIISKN